MTVDSSSGLDDTTCQHQLSKLKWTSKFGHSVPGYLPFALTDYFLQLFWEVVQQRHDENVPAVIAELRGFNFCHFMQVQTQDSNFPRLIEWLLQLVSHTLCLR